MPEIPAAQLPPDAVRRAGQWTVVNRDGQIRAVSSRCRHQFADLSKGSVGADGCLVCPWHGSRYDLDSGAMTQGPRGFLGYVGQTPGYTQLIAVVGKYLVLRRRAVTRQGESYVLKK